jgi:hypothetical protein
VGSSIFEDLEFALRVSKTQKDLRNFRIWFQDMVFKTWDLNFGEPGDFTVSKGHKHPLVSKNGKNKGEK